MTAQLTPRVRKTAQNTQHTYNLGRRIYDVKAYPVLSRQGATILIYGHENGLTLVWRGGRRFKAPKKDTRSEQAIKDKPNGADRDDDDVMVIDSDEEEFPAPARPFVDKPEFDESDTEESPFPEIIQTLDLSLGSAVRHIAVLPIPHSAAEDAAWGAAEILKEKMVFAVTCVTTDVYVITLPLTPPSHESKARPELKSDLLAGTAGRGLWGENLVSLAGQTHRSDSVAITIAKQQMPSSGSGRSKSADRSSSLQSVRVIVAAHSRQATGVLRLWDVMIGQKHPGSERPLKPFQTDYLPHPLTSISFNPTHTTQLLAVASPHAVRIYDYSLPSAPQDEADEPLPTQGSWLLSLYPPFIRAAGLSTARKPVVAASWIAHGHAVLALLADGQWGIWDIHGAGPSVSGSSGTSGGLFGRATTSSVRGAALTTFSASGYLEGTSPLRNPGTQKSSGDLVPMTPHTRRDAAISLSSGGPERLATIRGGIAVVQLPSQTSGIWGEESVVLWMGGVDYVVAVIPMVSRFWDAQVRRSAGGGVNLFSGAQPTRMIRLTNLGVGLLGERCCGIGAIPRGIKSSQTGPNGGGSGLGGGGTQEGLPIDVLIRGESRLIIVRETDDSHAVTASSRSSKLLGARKRVLGPAHEVEPPSAILVHPRPGATSAVVPSATFSKTLRAVSGTGSVRGRASLFGKRPPLDNGDEDVAVGGQRRVVSAAALSSNSRSFDADEPTFTQSMMTFRPRGGDASTVMGLGFAGDLDNAADADDNEEVANERNVEEEILNIMEIDRALEEMEDDRDSGTKHVFFETSR